MTQSFVPNSPADDADDDVYVFPASFAQQRLWFLDRFEPNSPFYNIPAAVRMTGRLDAAVLEQSLNEIVDRHETLRTTFALLDDQPMQMIAPTLHLPLPLIDLQHLPAAQREAEALRLAQIEARTPFDLERGPLLRMTLLRLQVDEHIALVTMHHIISDGWSVGVFVHELGVLYHALSNGRPVPLAPLPVQYADYAHWQRERLQGAVMEAQLSYWKQQLGPERGELPVLALPTDRPRPAVQSSRGASLSMLLPRPLVDDLSALSNREGVTLFMTLLAAFNVLLQRYSGQDDLCVGTPIANRTRAETEALIGCFINTLVLRADLGGNPSFRELLERTRRMALQAYAHQDVPFETLVEVLQPNRDMSHTPLFQVMFILQNATVKTQQLPGLTLSALDIDSGTATFDLTFSLSEQSDGLDVSVEYSIDLFNRDTIARMIGHFQTLLTAIVAQPDCPIADLPLLTAAERQQLLVEWNQTDAPFALDRCVHDVIAGHAARTPDAIAVVWDQQRLSYGELNRRANQLAYHLHTLGVGPETLVGICAERSLEMIVAVLAVLKAGGAYVPLDPAYPAERLRFMLDDAQVAVLLTNAAEAQESIVAGAAPVLDLARDWPVIAQQPTTDPATTVTPDHLAYVIYTSGSTGQPKGTQVTHRNLLNAYYAWEDAYDLGSVPSHLQMANFAFDVFSGDLVRALCSGARLVLCPRDYLLEPAQLYTLMQREQIACAEFVPAVLRLLIGHLAQTGQRLDFMQLLICGSDSWYAEEYATFSRYVDPRTRVINSYGLTEATIDSTYFERGALELVSGQLVPIGRPFANTQLYILDAQQQPVPIGVPGELVIGGAGVARGYLNRPELTAERFIDLRLPDGAGSASGHKRVYRTGDLARYCADGHIELLGRIDQQIKLRGQRIELGEIEAVLAQHPAVRENVVMVRTDAPGGARLVAYVVTEEPRTENQTKEPRTENQEPGGSGEGTNEQRNKGAEAAHRIEGQELSNDADGSQFLVPGSTDSSQFLVLGSADLRQFVQARLPEYMTPSLFVFLHALPLTPNGKLDRRALPEPDWSQVESTKDVAPRTPIETKLAEIWATVLNLPPIGIHSNFFELGGHSLLATQLISRVREAFALDLPLRAIFESPTVATFAEQVEAELRVPTDAPMITIGPAPRSEAMPLSFAQQRLWFLDQLEPNSPFYNIPEALRLRGALDIAALERSLNEVVRRHESLRTCFITVDGRPQQQIIAELALPLPLIDLAQLQPSSSPAEREAEALRLATIEAQQPFDLRHGPLLRAKLLRLDHNDHVVLLTMHHIIGDDWSTNVLISEVSALYAAFAAGQESPLAPLRIQYADYAYWQRRWIEGAVLEVQLDYWQQQLRGAPPVLELPTDRPRPAVQTFSGDYQRFVLPPELTAALNALSQREGATLFMTLLAAFNVLLQRYSAQDDIVVGTPVANRTRAETEALIGCFINTLVLRADLSDNPRFRTLLSRSRETALQAYAHQDLPFEMLVDKLQPQRDLSHTPLFQIMFALQNAPLRMQALPGTALRIEHVVDAHSGTAKFDLTLFMVEEGDHLSGAFEYNTDLFDAATITRLIEHFQTLLQGIVADPDQPVAALPLLTEAERQHLLVDWNDTTASYPAERCVHELFAEQAARTPAATAIVAGTRRLSYAQLHARSNQLAHHLRGLGVGPETLVGVCMTRSAELLIALLAVLKAGGAYVPLDPAYPAERLQFMLDDAGITILLTEHVLDDQLAATVDRPDAPMKHVLHLPMRGEQIGSAPITDLETWAAPDNLAYVIYTSGSTGRPKGTLITHRGLSNYLAWCLQAYPVAAGQGAPIHSSIAFDLTITGLFAPLLTGTAVHLLPDTDAIEPLSDALRTTGDFSLVKITPAHLDVLRQQLAPEQVAGRTRSFIIGGENLLAESLQFWQDHAPDTLLINEYGPTETVVGCCVYIAPPRLARSGSVPIGRPIINTHLYVLDREMQPVPVGVAGELYIGGVQVARGYLNRPALTAERFLPDPFAQIAGARLYRTGDRVCWTAEGVLDYLGRLDDQIKLRGFRIELGEIESVLRQLPAVSDAAVVLRRTAADEHELVAYVVGEPHTEPRTGALWAKQEPGEGGREPRTKNQEPGEGGREPRTKNQEPGEGSEGTREQGDKGTREQGNKGTTEQANTADSSRFSVLGSSDGSRLSVLGSAELRAMLRERLPEYMIPATFVWLDALPLTPNGKLDRRALPEPSRRDATALVERAPVMPRSEIEQRIAAIWQQVLQVEQVGVYDNFFDLGGHSLRLVQVRSKLREALDREITMTDLLTYPTISALAQHLADPQPTATAASAPQRATATRRHSSNAIAIVGIACAVPGARTPDAFWQQVRDGVESIAFFSDEELTAAGVAPELLSNPNYVKACPLLEEIDRFDASFWGFTPREAELMDPQQRLFLEYAWAALEDAGYGALGATESGNRIGVFAGMSLNSYLLVNLASNTELIAAAGGLQTLLANDKDFLPTRVSYKLNLKGPSINVQSACSTSLVAVHLACQSLLNNECDAALAGGVSIRAFDKTGYLYEEGGISSPDGHCRAFDAEASGTVSGNGLGVVVLKRLADAEADGDTIYAVIKGTAINNDGALKVGYTAPSVAGQAEVIAGALAAAGVPAETIGYVEAHGTATPLGDPIELAALSQVYRSQTAEQQFCAIGSVKTNLGHLDAAAGVIGLIKTALALRHQQLPPSLHFERPNPQIDLAISPFYVNTTLQPWPRGTNPRRAGVSSFGIGGTNVHLVLEEAPAAPRAQPAAETRPAHLLVLSAKTSASLDQASANLADYFARQPDVDLADVAYTLQIGRTGFNHRRVLVCSDAEDARSALLSLEPSRVTTVVQQPIERPFAFMFPGGGAQYVNMSRELYSSAPRFRQAIDRCADLLTSLCDLDLRAVLYPAPERLAEVTREIERTSIALPALFAVEYALAQLWIDWGVRPNALIGHSLGEYVAATLAGVFSLEDALQLVVLRGQLFERLPAGGMLSVALAEHELLPLIEAEPQLSIAALNGPQLSVVAGPADAIDQLGRRLTERGVECQRLHIAVAAHSALVEPILEPFAAFVERLSLHAPTIAFLSNVSGTWITAEEATDPGYWVTHLRQTVRFAAGVQTLLEQPGMVVLEVGPGRTLSSLARQHASPDQLVLSSLRHPRDRISDPVFLLQTLGRLWQARVAIDWPRVANDPIAPELRRRVPLPTYPFDRQRYWVEPRRQSAGDRTLLSKPPAQIGIDDWLYLPWWERTMSPSSAASEPVGRWLIFVDELGLGAALAQRLAQTGQHAVTVRIGQSFGRVDSSSYTIDPQSSADYRRLLTEIGGASTAEGHADALTTIVHCWSVAAPQPDRTLAERLAQAQTTGYHSLQLLVQALTTAGRIDTMQRKQPLRLAVISNGLHAVSDGEPIYPEKATLLGLCKVMPQEYPNLTCQSIDATPPRPGTRQAVALADLLCAELSAPAADDVLAYRGSQRWVQRFQPLPISAAPAQRTALRKRGVYVITGGLGGIGLVLAEHLARTVQARLVLVGRTALPDRGGWDDLLAQQPDAVISQKLRTLRAIEAHGGEVLLAAADVADAEQMASVVAEAERRFGAIHGVIHAAGLPGGGLIQLKSAAQVDAVFAPKVQGALVLDALFADRPLDFMLLWSSLGTILGGLGQADYCAANAFLDAYAQFAATARSNVTLAVNWDRWQQIGMALPLETEHRTRTGVELGGGMSSAEGCEMFERVLDISGPAQIVVAPRDLPSLIAGSRATSAAGLLEALEQSQSSRPTHPRPALASSYVEPRSEIERQIATVWQDVLGIDQIGIHDNFFELGGHSLLATQVMSRLRNVVRVDLPLHHLFEQPTVAELATLVVQQQVAQADQQAIAQLLAEIQQLSQHEAQQLLAAERQSSERDGQRE